MSAPSGILVVDVGTSGVRAAIVDPDGTVTSTRHRPVLPQTPAPGLVEVDGAAIKDAVMTLSNEVLAAAGPVAGVGIANQRATTMVWDRETGVPAAPGIGWQDLRTVGTCLVLQAEGLRLAPNATAAKLAAILDQVDPDRTGTERLCAGTIDTWVAWILSGDERLHVTDASNAAVTQLVTFGDTIEWDDHVLGVLRIPRSLLPRIVDSSGPVGTAAALPGAPPICGIAGDQQASLIGQGCTRTGLAKATFGTGGMLDLCTDARPGAAEPGDAGTFPIVAWQRQGRPTWGVEAAMLTAGTCVEWLRDDLGIIDTVEASADVARRSDPAADVWFVPALLGMGAPVWDFGARGALLGLTRGSGRSEIVHAVLRGVAQRGADLLEAAEADGGMTVGSLRVDGGMTANDVFVQELADALGRPVEVSRELEATTLGAGYLAGIATGLWRDEDEIAEAWAPRRTVGPSVGPAEHQARRSRWLDARARAERTIPDLSGISF